MRRGKSVQTPITCAAEAEAVFRPAWPRGRMRLQECFLVLPVDAKCRPLCRPQLVSMGTLEHVEVALRDVFREAVKRNAYGVLVAHNHPSGMCEPSGQDLVLLRELIAGGKLLGIAVLDSLVLTSDACQSLVERYGRE
jgi:DNA repair protein RadC